ncbi:hypothetical protein LTR12_012668 [Friedmanniomyces endolithicus]|nr:hypothetical protein LTR74_004605 [Friedmanniomyces endolithicus]KAK1812932.1 hypothetical protein LTR12_012668 [Friedmanniomyces endolithicus]
MAEHLAGYEVELYHETIVYIEEGQGDDSDAIEQEFACWNCDEEELGFGGPCWITAAMLVPGSITICWILAIKAPKDNLMAAEL